MLYKKTSFGTKKSRMFEHDWTTWVQVPFLKCRKLVVIFYVVFITVRHVSKEGSTLTGQLKMCQVNGQSGRFFGPLGQDSSMACPTSVRSWLPSSNSSWSSADVFHANVMNRTSSLSMAILTSYTYVIILFMYIYIYTYVYMCVYYHMWRCACGHHHTMFEHIWHKYSICIDEIRIN